jgi:MFS family permease
MVLIFYGMLVFAPLLVFKDSLGILFFTNYYGYSKTVACHMMSTTLFASIIGAPLLGAISDRMQRRRPVLILTPIIILITLVLMMLNINTGNEFFNQVITTALTFSFGFMTWGFLLCYTVFKEINPPHILSIGLGLMNSINMIGGILSVPFITYLIDKLPEHYPLMQNSELYFYAFLILPIIILMSFPLLKDIPETGCRQVE